MAAKVGQLVVDFFLNTAKFEKDLKTTTYKLRKAGQQMQDIGRTLTASVTLPLVAAGASIVKFGSSFESSMTKSTAIMGKLSKAMVTDMEKAALDVAKTTTFSASQAADSYYFLASAGLDAAQSIKALPQVAQFAQAGMFDMALATDLLTDAQSALGLSSKDAAENLEGMTRVSDVLVKANTLANASVQQFSEALTNKAGAALRVLGKDVEEGTAVLAAFADQGVKGAEAGTQLSIVFRDMQKSAISNKEAFRKFGISVYDSGGEMRNVADIIADMERALTGMSDEQKKATLTLLGFSEKSVSAQLTLLGTSQKIRDYEKALRSAAGTTDEVAKNQLKSFSATMQLLGSRVEAASITMFNSLKPVIVDSIIPAFEKAITKLEGFVDWFAKLDPGMQKFILVSAGIAAAIGPATYALGSFMRNGVVLLPLLGKMATGFKALAISMGPITLGMLGLAAAVVIYREEITTAIIKSLAFLGVMHDITDEAELASVAYDQFGGDALSRYAEKINLTSRELRDLVKDHKNAIIVLNKNKEAVDDLRIKLLAGTITHQEYVEGLREILEPAKRNTETQAELSETIDAATSGLAAEIQALLGFKDASNEAEASAKNLYESLKEIGIVIEQGNLNPDQWLAKLIETSDEVYGTAEQRTESFVARQNEIFSNLFSSLDVPEFNYDISDLFPVPENDIPDWIVQLGEDFQKAQTPLTELLKEFGKLNIAGIASSEIIKQYSGQIISAADAQKRYGVELSETEKALLEEAKSVELTNQIMAEAARAEDPFEVYVSRHAEMIQRIEELREADLLSEQQAVQLKAQLNDDLNRKRLSGIQSFFGQLQVLSRSGNRTLAMIGKAAAVSQATIDGILAVQKALASLPPPGNFIMAGAVGAATAANVAAIMTTPIGFKKGGLVTGGEQIIRVNEGGRPEFMVNADATSKFLPFLKSINSDNPTIKNIDSIPSFDTGGSTRPSLNVKIENYGTSKQFSIEQIDEDTVRIIARDEATDILARNGPSVIANDLSNPNSRTSKAMGMFTTARRMR